MTIAPAELSTLPHRAYLGLGSNLDQPIKQIQRALEDCHQHNGMHVLTCSPLYSSSPLGPEDQPDFVNAVALIATSLKPLDLLEALQHQEQRQQRIKKRHWGERTIDLDILLYDDLVMDSERLTIPHKEMTKRGFVVEPLVAIARDLVLPGGHKLDDIQPQFGGNLKVIADSPLAGR